MSDNNSKKEKVQFEGKGVFLGLISYPFYVDGKDLYKNVFKPFFKEHKKALMEYDPDVINNKRIYSNKRKYGMLYKPAGYRLFGSKGLAVLSLVDDYSFYNRFFNKNHIQSLHKKTTKKQDADEEKWKEYMEFKSEVISGVVEHHGDDPLIKDRAFTTFLNKKPQKFIGIARLKINYYFLKGKGLETVWKIKERIKELHNNQNMGLK